MTRKTLFIGLFSFGLLLNTVHAQEMQEPDSAPIAEPDSAEQDEKENPTAAEKTKDVTEDASENGSEAQKGSAFIERRADLKAVLRGFYLGLQTGIGVLPKEVNGVRYIPGGDIGLRIGGDVNELFSIQALLFYNAFGNYKGEEDRDLIMMGGRLAFLFTPWSEERLYLQTGVGFGVLYYDDAMTIPFTQSLSANVIGSLEYYTDLRHFSVGVDLDVQFIFNEFNANIQVLPHVRYTF